MSGSFDGASVIVTGAARGLGRGIAEAFLREGASVLICDVNEAGVSATGEELAFWQGAAVASMYADVAVADDMRAVVRRATERHGPVDHVINNAGMVTIAVLGDDRRGLGPDHRRKPQGRLPRRAGGASGDARPGPRVDRQHRLSGGQAGQQVHRALLRVQGGRHQPDPDRGARGGSEGAGHLRLPRIHQYRAAGGGVRRRLRDHRRDRDAIKAGRERRCLARFQEVEDVAGAVLFLPPSSVQTTGEALNISGGMVMDMATGVERRWP